MMHDFVLTLRYVKLFNFPLMVWPKQIIWDQFSMEYEPENGVHIGFLAHTMNAMTDTSQEIRWYDCQLGVVLHTVNAYETSNGDKLTCILHHTQFRGKLNSKECTDMPA